MSAVPGAAAWWTSTYYLKPIAKLATRARGYGLDRIPPTGGCVLAINHIHWIDIPVVGAVTPRRLNFVAKVEALRFPGFGRYIAWYGTIGIRRGESDRDAVRQMRTAARNGAALGIFVEGTRQLSGRPGRPSRGPRWSRFRKTSRCSPSRCTEPSTGGSAEPCSIAVGEPVRYDGLPKGGRGYKEATADIERRIVTLFDWLADVHRRGRPKGLTPPL